MSEHGAGTPPADGHASSGSGLLLPLLAAAVLVWSTADRQQQLDKIPVAIVNSDTIVSQPQTVAAGRALAASLTNPDLR